MTASVISEIASEFAVAGYGSAQPKYLRLVDSLVEAIEGGLLGPGDRVPPEDRLATQFNVSLGTVQKALGILASRGFVFRAPRRGTFVAAGKSTEVYDYRFRDEETGNLITPFTRVLSVSEASPDGRWARFLKTDRCVRVERIQWIEGDPPAYSEFYIPFAYGGQLLRERPETLHGASFHRVIADRFNLPTIRTCHGVTCNVLTPTACDHLLVPEGSFGSVWEAVGYSFKEATTYQLLQLAAGHRPIEWERDESA